MTDKIEEVKKILSKYSSIGAYGSCILYGFEGENWNKLAKELDRFYQTEEDEEEDEPEWAGARHHPELDETKVDPVSEQELREKIADILRQVRTQPIMELSEPLDIADQIWIAFQPAIEQAKQDGFKSLEEVAEIFSEIEYREATQKWYWWQSLKSKYLKPPVEEKGCH